MLISSVKAVERLYKEARSGNDEKVIRIRTVGLRLVPDFLIHRKLFRRGRESEGVICRDFLFFSRFRNMIYN